MKLSTIYLISVSIASAAAFSTQPNTEVSSRKAFLTNTAAAFFTATSAPLIANAGTMAQENVDDPTEVWETGSPSADAKAKRVARYTNARNQMNSNFAPQKRLTLERKSPVTRLDINAPNFEAYKRTFPGLYKKAP